MRADELCFDLDDDTELELLLMRLRGYATQVAHGGGAALACGPNRPETYEAMLRKTARLLVAVAVGRGELARRVQPEDAMRQMGVSQAEASLAPGAARQQPEVDVPAGAKVAAPVQGRPSASLWERRSRAGQKPPDRNAGSSGRIRPQATCSATHPAGSEPTAPPGNPAPTARCTMHGDAR